MKTDASRDPKKPKHSDAWIIAALIFCWPLAIWMWLENEWEASE